MYNFLRPIAVLATVALAPAFASNFTTYTYVNSSGSNSYEAIITVDNAGTGGTGDLTIELVDLQSAPGDDTALISGINFTLSGGGASLVSPTSYSGGEVATANSNGTLTPVYATLTALPSASLRWKNVGSGNNVQFTTLSGGQPSQLILGNPPAGTGGVYNSGSFNASITGHSPDIVGSATFVYSNVSGISNSTTLSNVQFVDGTMTSNTVGAMLLVAPEPAGFLMLGGGLVAIGLLGRRGKRRAR